ncbi:hypothetical protein Tco_0883535, partial [Tanacetum coccineum]
CQHTKDEFVGFTWSFETLPIPEKGVVKSLNVLNDGLPVQKKNCYHGGGGHVEQIQSLHSYVSSFYSYSSSSMIP